MKFDRSLLPRQPDFEFEQALWSRGVFYVAGLDEAGRGALAGPVAAGAVIFPADPELAGKLLGVRDSKQMAPGERQDWSARLPALALAHAVAFASAKEIDDLGIVPATRLAMQRALGLLGHPPQHLLLDYLVLPECALPQTPLVKGDARSLSIAAASILAKHARDSLMREIDAQFPGYGLAIHKGYSTPMHRAAIQMLDLSPVHRRSFRWS